MNNIFQGRNFVKEIDFTSEELAYIIDFSIHLKQLKKKGIPHEYLKGQNICLLFEKSSTRTRAAFTVAANDLGARPEYLGTDDIQLGNKESVQDTARVLGSMFDGIEYRGYEQDVVEELAKYANVPVWNGLSNQWHPTQMIADFMTLKEEFGRLRGLNLVYCGDGRNNIARSLLITGSMLGVNITIASPQRLFPDQSVIDLAKEYSEKTGAEPIITSDIQQAVIEADALYTDVWVSMGEEDKVQDRLRLLEPYQINRQLTDQIQGDWVLLHCLPAFHDTNTEFSQYVSKQFDIEEMEVTDEIFRSEHGRQFQQAENRMHSIKAVMALTNGHLFIPNV